MRGAASLCGGEVRKDAYFLQVTTAVLSVHPSVRTLQSWEASSTKVSRVLTSSPDEACPASCTVSMVCSPARTVPPRPPAGANEAEARREERLEEASLTTWVIE